MVTTAPPRVVALDGVTPVTEGVVVLKVYSSLELVDEAPSKVTIVISTNPAAAGGAVATIVWSETTVKALAGTAPKSTPCAPVNPLPDIVTSVPPPVAPEAGATGLTVGVGST